MFSNANELVNYINYQSTSELSDRSARIGDPITHFSLFSHGLEKDGGTINLGFTYSSDNPDLVLKTSHIDNIYDDSFKNPVSRFYSCNTGTAGDISFAQLWANRTGGSVSAYQGYSYYGGVPSQSLYTKTMRTLWSSWTGVYPLGGLGVKLPVAGTNAKEVYFYKK